VNAIEEAPKDLRGVISIIPESCYENPAWKGLTYIAVDVLLYGVCIWALTVTDSPLLLIPLWIVTGLSLSGLFILGHDAAHGALFASRRMCEAFGKVLMLPALHAYSAWELGHNRVHHSFTIRQEKDFVWHPLSLDEYKELSWFGKLKHRVEWSAFGAGIYYLVEIWWKKMFVFTPPKQLAKNISADKRSVIYFVLFTLVLCLVLGRVVEQSALYMSWVWFKILVVPWLIFNYVIGATVHIHHIQPDIPWHADGVWNKFKGQVEGTTNFRLPKILNVFFHNIFIHIPHHVDARIPFYNLPQAAESIKEHYQLFVRDQKFKWRTYFRATRACKLYDFERDVWLNYRGKISSELGRLQGICSSQHN